MWHCKKSKCRKFSFSKIPCRVWFFFSQPVEQALGGFLLEREASLNTLPQSDFLRGSVETLQFSSSERVCQLLRLSLEGKCGGAANWIDYHHAYVVGFLGLFLALLSIWPLSSDWRRRRRLQRQRKDRQDIVSSHKKVLLGSEIVDETTALLC